jgi:hypothetical protein
VPVTIDKLAEIEAAIRELARTQLLVGIPAEKDPRPGEPIGNAAIGYIQNFGSPAANIPAREWLGPGIESVQGDIEAGMRAAGEAAGAGDIAKAEQIMDAVGITARNGVVAYISSNIPPPLAESTIRNRRRRSKGSTYRRKAVSASDVTTLIDSGQLRASVSWVKHKS